MTNRTCSISGCDRPVRARGWCNMHWRRWANTGDPGEAYARRFADVDESFERRTEQVGGCVVWVGAKNNHGYGVLRRNGKNFYAHRYAFERSVGPIPEGFHIDHTCHNPPCVNPDHLRAVTRQQNMENRRSASATNKTGLRGVSERRGKFVACVTVHGKSQYLGMFETAEDAAQAAAEGRKVFMTHSLN